MLRTLFLQRGPKRPKKSKLDWGPQGIFGLCPHGIYHTHVRAQEGGYCSCHLHQTGQNHNIHHGNEICTLYTRPASKVTEVTRGTCTQQASIMKEARAGILITNWGQKGPLLVGPRKQNPNERDRGTETSGVASVAVQWSGLLPLSLFSL